MNTSITIIPSELSHFLWHTALVRPAFIWGPPGIGKSSLVQQFAEEVELPCISLLGSQLAPEDLIGVPQIIDSKSRFCPPTMIAQEEQYCLFLDKLNACSHEVQKAFYSLILEKRIGEDHMPKGSIVIGAGNRAEDSAIVKPMSSALINRMVHIQLKASHRDWLAWADRADIHPWIMDYIKARPDHLWSKPPKHEAPFSTPRGWHMLSDALKQYDHAIPESVIEVLAFGCVSPEHAGQFKSFIKQVRHKNALNDILKGDLHWPDKPEDRDVLYFLAPQPTSGLYDRRRAAVDVDGDTCQIAGPLRSQEGNDVSRLLGFANPAQWHAAVFHAFGVNLIKGQVGIRLLLPSITPLMLAAFDETDADRIDQNVVFGQIFRQAFGNRDARRPGDGRRHGGRPRGASTQVGDVDDPAPADFAHFRDDRPDEADRTPDLQAEVRFPVIIAHGFKRLGH
jgi:hypothetical protein